ncbi:hypothetical protein [Halorientalis halophila]|uniref:hypothetical protein n=1 Tax=Halorientalis halophila TaxID=3108499 RepID=UPI00300BB273
MVEVGLLQCPVCDDRRLCPVDGFDDAAELKEVASEHLRSHRLLESKLGIYRVKMVRELNRIEVERPGDLTTNQWTDEPEAIRI